MLVRLILITLFATLTAFFQNLPPIEPGVSHELAKWRAARYSDVRYKLNLTLEKMSPVLKGTIEIRVTLSEPPASAGGQKVGHDIPPIILDWRKIKGHEDKSTVSNISVNGQQVSISANWPPTNAGGSDFNEHLIFRDGVVLGENVIKLDFISPILTSGSAITRYVDKEDGAEYIYSLFVPSDASTAFPVFDQPDLKARFTLRIDFPWDWAFAISNTPVDNYTFAPYAPDKDSLKHSEFKETKPISTYVFAFAAGPFERVSEPGTTVTGALAAVKKTGGEGLKAPVTIVPGSDSDAAPAMSIYVRKSQAAKFKPHAAEVFRLNREGIKYLESYFDYKFPFPKYDIVLIPEFPFGGMEHAGATFLREASVIFPQEPTKNDYFTRANLIFHEAAHQWFGDTVTMIWFDDLWLKEGFAEFMAYKTSSQVMPEYNVWKIFYERNKQAAYLTDSTKGTTPIYQEIANLNAAKSAYGNIVYRKAPSFLKQAEFYIGSDKFQTAVRAFLKKHEFANAGWEDMVTEFENAWLSAGDQINVVVADSDKNRIERIRRDEIRAWAHDWVTKPGLDKYRVLTGIILSRDGLTKHPVQIGRYSEGSQNTDNGQRFALMLKSTEDRQEIRNLSFSANTTSLPIPLGALIETELEYIFPNYGDYGYRIFLLDDKSRDYVLKNIQNEKDPFLRSMMWGSLWDSVREGELDPKEYVELVVRNIKPETDESTVQTLLSRVSTAMRYYLAEPPALAGGTNSAIKTASSKRSSSRPVYAPPAYAGGSALASRLENLLIDRMQNAQTPGLRITYYRAFLNLASSENARRIMKVILKGVSGSEPPASAGGQKVPKKAPAAKNWPPADAGGSDKATLTTKDKFDIVSKLIILGDPDAAKLLATLEKTETSDEAKRYAYAARAGFASAESKAKYWNDFTANKDISESWIEAAFVPFNSTRHADLTLPYLERALGELPNHKRSRKIFFVNGWLAAFIGGQRSEEALKIVNKFLADNPNLDKDLRLKVLENVDLIERAVRIRGKYAK